MLATDAAPRALTPRALFALSRPPADGSAPGEEGFYTQPGSPLDARNAATRPPRRKLPFSLLDTPATLRAKEAGRAGLSMAGYEQAQLAGGAGAGAGAGARAGADTLAAAARAALTADEAAFLSAGHDEDDLLATIQRFQRTADEYGAVPNKDAAAGVARAKAVVADAAAKLATLRALNAKLRRLSDDFDARSVLKAQAQAAAAAHAMA